MRRFYVRPTWSYSWALREHNHDILMVRFYVSSFTHTFSLQPAGLVYLSCVYLFEGLHNCVDYAFLFVGIVEGGR